MSPKDPLPILRPRRYLFPTRSSMLQPCCGRSRDRSSIGPPAPQGLDPSSTGAWQSPSSHCLGSNLGSLCSRAARCQVVLMPTHLGKAEAGLEQVSLSSEKMGSEPRPRKGRPSRPSSVSLLRGRLATERKGKVPHNASQALLRP